MYVDGSARKISTHLRPRAGKVTAALPHSHHPLEDILRRPVVRRALLWLTQRGRDGKTRFENVCESYDNPSADKWTRVQWAIPHQLINLGIKKAGWNKEAMKKNLFHHPPTVRSLILSMKSIGIYGLTVPQRFTAPLFTVWNLTQACNLNCKHCYQDAKPRVLADELTTAEKCDLLDQMAEEFVPFVAFAGGEPMLAPDLWPVLEHCRKVGMHVSLATNGMFLTPAKCERLKEAGVKYIEVSIDSLNPREHDEFRGQRGAWVRSIQGIRNSVAAGIRTGMATCFMRETVDTVDDVINFAISLGCRTFAHFNFIPAGRGREMMQHDLSPGQREFLMGRLQRRLVEGRISVISTAPQFGRSCILYGPDEGVFATGHVGNGEGRKTMVLSRYVGGCGAGRCYCSIQPNGIISACVYMPAVEVGDIRRQSFKQIWNNSLFDTLSDRDDRGDHCGVCDYKSYCGGCRARAIAYTGDIQAGDPGCVYNFREWQELAARAGGLAAGAGAGDGISGGDAGSAPRGRQEHLQLVQIAAVGAVSAAARSSVGVEGMREEDVRHIGEVADRLKDIYARQN